VRALLILVCCVALCPGALTAQPREATDPHLRNDCRLAAQVVKTGHPGPHQDWAYSVISQCTESGPGALAETWRTAPPADREGLNLLLGASASFHTRTLFEAAAVVAHDAAASETTRVYAISLLFAYARPGESIDVQDLLQLREGQRARTYRGSHGDNPSDPHTLGDVETEVEEVLSRIAEAETGSVTGRAAAEALRQLQLN
jgi:hypothetical protein